MSQSKKAPTPFSEIIAQLLKPARMGHVSVTVFVEGPDDVVIYREIARKNDMETQFSFEQRGGRTPLFNDFSTVYKNHEKLSLKILFFADKDTYVFEKIPHQYANIHFTNGYSIENDLFQDGKDFLMAELSANENDRFNNLIKSVSEWFAFEIDLILKGKNSDTKIDISGLNPEIIKANAHKLEDSFLKSRGFIPTDAKLTENIKNRYAELLRGKILFELLLRIAFDRESPLHVKNKENYWNTCITEGKRKFDSSNTGRILGIFKHKMQGL